MFMRPDDKREMHMQAKVASVVACTTDRRDARTGQLYIQQHTTG